MITQEQVVKWCVFSGVSSATHIQKLFFLQELERDPVFIRKEILKVVPRMIGEAAGHFREGLEIINLDLDQFAEAIEIELKKNFISNLN